MIDTDDRASVGCSGRYGLHRREGHDPMKAAAA